VYYIYTYCSQYRDAGRAEEIEESGTAVNAACHRYVSPGLGQCRVKFLRACAHIADNFWRSSFACGKPEFINTVFLVSPATSWHPIAGWRPGNFSGWPVPSVLIFSCCCLSVFSNVCHLKHTRVLLTVLDTKYRGTDKSLVRPTSRCILFDGENISFDASLFSTNIPPIMIINGIYEHQNLLLL
jgi:hypothetical protein